ncbi:MAG: hypothetical protein AVO33_00760 [delta proteobacterium ML8_F1]|nr:MAG: hypothetical protein AVO33_00760 [delta proteobacterium ML8_F1]
MHKVVLDVDTGIDDAIALVIALGSAEIEILGISTVSGNVDVEKSTRNTLRLLKFLGRGEVGVYKGSNEPLDRPLVDASKIHGSNGLNGQLEDMADYPGVKGAAMDFYREVFSTYPGEVTLIMTGPQTNLARLLRESPEMAFKIKRVIAMGGALRVPGNHTPLGEFNIMTDPMAAYENLHAGIEDFSLISLDVTLKALIVEEDFKEVTNQKLREFILGLLHQYMDRYETKNGLRAVPMHDPLTVLHLLHPGILTMKKHYLTVEFQSLFSDGHTICDFQGQYQRVPNAYVPEAIDVAAFKRAFIEGLNRGGQAL